MNYKKNRIPPKQWKPGEAPYRDFLNKLTPEEYTAHLEARRRRKEMRTVMKKVTEEFQSIWVSELHNAAWKLLERARNTGDAVAFAAVWDRIIGKESSNIDLTIDQNKPLPFKDDDLA
tara:strand:+ start:1317 stop:1670 length:354 start_codon:yes stop_codon:yes gene_type:complete